MSGEVNLWGPARAAGSAGHSTHLWGGGVVVVLRPPRRHAGSRQAAAALAKPDRGVRGASSRGDTSRHKALRSRAPFFFFEGLRLVGLRGNGSPPPTLPPLPLHSPLVWSHAASGGHSGCSRHYLHYGAVGRPRSGCAPGRRPLL